MSNSHSDTNKEPYGFLLLPQEHRHKLKLISSNAANAIISIEGGDGEYLSISPSLVMRVIVDDSEDPQYSLSVNKHLILACPSYNNVFGPVIIEGPLKELKALKSSRKKLRKILTNDIKARQDFQNSFLTGGCTFMVVK